MKAKDLEQLADEMELRRVPMLLAHWREQAAVAGRPPAAWRMRRDVTDATRDAWRHLHLELEPRRGGRRSAQQLAAVKVSATMLREVNRRLEAALLAASPDAMPKLAGDAIRELVAARR